MIAIFSLVLVLLLSMVVVRVATEALVLTGLSHESARFQARSAFSGSGFTTAESEKVVQHPVRRRIIMGLMMLGNAGIITAMSSLILSFVTTHRQSGISGSKASARATAGYTPTSPAGFRSPPPPESRFAPNCGSTTTAVRVPSKTSPTCSPPPAT